MPTISTVAQGGAQRSEQYLEARTGDGARSAEKARAPERSVGVNHDGHPFMGGTVNKALAPPPASRRRCYNQAAHRGQATHTTDARAAQRERAPAAQRRLSVSRGVERDRTARRCGSGAKAAGREWRKESAKAGARQGRRCRDRRACDRERSWRMVVLGRRIARGGRERGAKPSPPATRGRSRSRSGTPERWPFPLVLSKPALAGVGALRGVPARMGRARRRLDRGERLFPVVNLMNHEPPRYNT